jgi:hypothetical protein
MIPVDPRVLRLLVYFEILLVRICFLRESASKGTFNPRRGCFLEMYLLETPWYCTFAPLAGLIY